jgi:hypothetical protein
LRHAHDQQQRHPFQRCLGLDVLALPARSYCVRIRIDQSKIASPDSLEPGIPPRESCGQWPYESPPALVSRYLGQRVLHRS